MNKRFATYICYTIMALFAMVLTIPGPLLTDIASTYSLSMAQSGIIFSANFIGFLAFILGGGMLADRLGKKIVLFVSLVGLTVSLVLFALSPDFYIACIVMFLVGGFGGMLESLGSALISELNTENPGFYVNLSQVFFGIAALVGPVSAGILVASGVRWQVCYFILGGLSFAITLLFSRVKLPDAIKQDTNRHISLAKAVSDKKFLLICLCMMFYTGSEVGSWGWMSTFLKKNMGLSVIMSSVSVGVFWAAMTVGRLLCGVLTLRYGIRRIVTVLGYSSAAVTIVAGIVSSELALFAAIAGMGLTYSSQWPLIVSYGGEHFKTSSGTVFALLIGSGTVGSALVPYIMGVIGEYINTRVAMISPAVLLLMVGLIFTAMGKEKRIAQDVLEYN